MGVLQVEHNDQAQPSLHNESLDVRKAVGEATLERAFQNLDSGNFRVDPEPPDTLPGQINTLDNLNLADSMTPRIKRRRRARLRDNNTQPYPIPEVRTPEGSTEYIPSKEIISALQAQLELDDKSSEIRIIDNKNKFWVSTLEDMAIWFSGIKQEQVSLGNDLVFTIEDEGDHKLRVCMFGKNFVDTDLLQEAILMNMKYVEAEEIEETQPEPEEVLTDGTIEESIEGKDDAEIETEEDLVDEVDHGEDEDRTETEDDEQVWQSRLTEPAIKSFAGEHTHFKIISPDKTERLVFIQTLENTPLFPFVDNALKKLDPHRESDDDGKNIEYLDVEFRVEDGTLMMRKRGEETTVEVEILDNEELEEMFEEVMELMEDDELDEYVEDILRRRIQDKLTGGSAVFENLFQAIEVIQSEYSTETLNNLKPLEELEQKWNAPVIDPSSKELKKLSSALSELVDESLETVIKSLFEETAQTYLQTTTGSVEETQLLITLMEVIDEKEWISNFETVSKYVRETTPTRWQRLRRVLLKGSDKGTELVNNLKAELKNIDEQTFRLLLEKVAPVITQRVETIKDQAKRFEKQFDVELLSQDSEEKDEKQTESEKSESDKVLDEVKNLVIQRQQAKNEQEKRKLSKPLTAFITENLSTLSTLGFGNTVDEVRDNLYDQYKKGVWNEQEKKEEENSVEIEAEFMQRLRIVAILNNEENYSKMLQFIVKHLEYFIRTVSSDKIKETNINSLDEGMKMVLADILFKEKIKKMTAERE